MPEKLLFETYYRTFKDLGPKLPALLPQVYLHYDPRTVERSRFAAAVVAS